MDDSVFVHAPLPYCVVLRVSLTDDAPAEDVTVRLHAYSVLEAMMQASIQASGGAPDGARCKVVEIGPDLAVAPAAAISALKE